MWYLTAPSMILLNTAAQSLQTLFLPLTFETPNYTECLEGWKKLNSAVLILLPKVNWWSHRWFAHISDGEVLRHALFSRWTEANELSSLSVHTNDSPFTKTDDLRMGNAKIGRFLSPVENKGTYIGIMAVVERATERNWIVLNSHRTMRIRCTRPTERLLNVGYKQIELTWKHKPIAVLSQKTLIS